ncbi:MAG TPA: DUF763 domain-containing protein [Clostridia bacterium]|nr:DUF763 domain-containing protein [Clostridia bacterium]
MMGRTGISQIPLHGGQCPPWLFAKMKKLAAVMIEVIAYEYGSGEVLRRLADPFWFQAFGCVLGFDWHSSGLTTVVCGALKEGLRAQQGELGLFFAGGKGNTSRKTPEEIVQAGEKYGLANDLQALQRTSRLVAKVDSAAVQDGYQLYHHFFVFDRDGNWSVVQQGMNQQNRFARRYHWLSDGLESFVNDPHQGICGVKGENVLNLVSGQNMIVRKASVELCHAEKPEKILRVVKAIQEQYKLQAGKKQEQPGQSPGIDTPGMPGRSGMQGMPALGEQLSWWSALPEPSAKTAQNIKTAIDTPTENSKSTGEFVLFSMPSYHPIPAAQRLNKTLFRLYEKPPANFEALLEEQGVGPATLRALAMVAEVTHGVKAVFADPVRYSFAHGGKDGYPFPVNKKDMEHSIDTLRVALEKGKIGQREKLDALRKLAGVMKDEQSSGIFK